jgi:hypothetical protein
MILMADGWAPLDAMTRGGAGLTVYQASDNPVFWTAPTFGTELQNRLWNFLPSREQSGVEPEVYYFSGFLGAPLYLGKRSIARRSRPMRDTSSSPRPRTMRRPSTSRRARSAGKGASGVWRTTTAPSCPGS